MSLSWMTVSAPATIFKLVSNAARAVFQLSSFFSVSVSVSVTVATAFQLVTVHCDWVTVLPVHLGGAQGGTWVTVVVVQCGHGSRS